MAADALMGNRSTPLAWPVERLVYDSVLDTLREQIPGASWAIGWAAGRALSAEEAVARAQAGPPAHGRSPPAQPRELPRRASSSSGPAASATT
jgi:hypothetical protein